ncbi:hypothetical protein C0995_007204 [Termitomyces sp. Mi166|nr:hypothetical protein C0995_007204 [Termitomyces sp. Mi166\
MPSTTILERISAFESLATTTTGPRSPLIDLQEWVVDDGVRAPPLPLAPPPPLPPRKHSLPVDHTYPPLDSRSRHAPASSVSSFHSVSLSSDTDPATPDSIPISPDSISLHDSYEEISTPKLPHNSPIRRPPPPPPDRSPDRSSILSTTTSYSSSSPSSTHLRVKRPTPVPPAARIRYDAVFTANIIQQRRAEQQKARQKPPLLSPEQARGAQRRAAGWRGLSVDLLTDVPLPGSASSKDDEVVGPTDRLEGRFVKPIWRRSRLGRRTLGEIWNECDPEGTGSLTRDQFAKAMWRIDEELRRAQVQALKSTSTGSLGSLRTFKPPPLPKNKPILR